MGSPPPLPGPLHIPGFNPNLTLGPLLLGHTVSSLLFGILTLQTYLYYGHFPNDPLRFKLAVAFIWFLELAHFITILVEIWIDIVTNYGAINFLVEIPRLFTVSFFLAAFVLLIFTLVFADRVYRMSKNIYIFLFLCAAAVVRAVIGIWNFAAIWTSDTIQGYLNRWRWLIPLQLGFGLVTDLVITIMLVLFLRRRDTSVNPNTTKIMDTLMWWSIESSASTVFFGVVSLVTILVLSKTFVWIAPLLVITRVYSNVLLASLNSREKLRAINNESSVVIRTNPTTLTAQSDPIYPMYPMEPIGSSTKSYGVAQ